MPPARCDVDPERPGCAVLLAAALYGVTGRLQAGKDSGSWIIRTSGISAAPQRSSILRHQSTQQSKGKLTVCMQSLLTCIGYAID